MSRRLTNTVIVVALLVLSSGCDLVDPARPTPQPDTEVFGNLIGVEQKPDAPGVWTASVRVGIPRALRRAATDDGEVAPELEEGIAAEITVSHDTVVLVNDRPAAVGDLNPGTEVVAIPVPGTTVMIGSNSLVLQSAFLMDFETYRMWRLPRLAGASDPAPVNDPLRINSAGVEAAPVPVAGGEVLYFSARLRPPAMIDGEWSGAIRDGLAAPAEGEGQTERSFRAELGAEGWSRPELVVLPGIDEALVVRVTWVSEAEDRCLVTVIDAGKSPWIGMSTRSGGGGWSAVEPMANLGDDAADGVFLGGSTTRMTFVTARAGGRQTDLYMHDSEVEDAPLPLEPKINTLGSEWGPRVGFENELFFVRGDRQMVLMGGSLSGVRLPGPHRAMLNQVAPTADGRWLFFCLPKLRSMELDQDIYVARWNEDKSMGEAVPVDEWRLE